MGYSGGTQTNYGDLQNGGSEVSDIFGPSYWPQTGGLPVYAGEGNHGQNTIGLHNWPEANIAQSSGGVYAYDSYPAFPADGTTAASYPDAWYAVSDGNVRLYVIDAAWADGNVGNTNMYQVDHDAHWTTSSPEYKWLAADLASHPGSIKMAVFHYPLRSDNSTQSSDTNLENTGSNPNSLEALLASNGVQLAFNGHAHTYQRIAPTNYQQTGKVVNYVTGGGGGVLEPVSGGSACSGFTSTGSIYALGWSPTSNTGTACGTGVPTPQSAAQVYNYLQVSVNGNQVTVTPVNAAGQSFDQQTYTYSGVTSTPATVIDSPPPTLTKATTASITFHAPGSTSYTCSLDAATATGLHQPGHLLRAGPGQPQLHRDRQRRHRGHHQLDRGHLAAHRPDRRGRQRRLVHRGRPGLDGLHRQHRGHRVRHLPERHPADHDHGDGVHLLRHLGHPRQALLVHRRRPRRGRQRVGPELAAGHGHHAHRALGAGPGPDGRLVDHHGDPARGQHAR